LRVRDENAAPFNAAMPAKTLHQRTKSASALSTLIKNGIKANPQRRTAFADVSNTTRPAAPAKDDMVFFEKGVYDALPLKSTLQPLKEIPDSNQQAPRPAALLRPAQRPLSAVIQKSLPAVPVSTIASAVPRQSVTEPSCDVVRKAVNKRATTVFKETTSYSDSEARSSDASNVERKVPVHQILEPPREHPVPSVPEPVSVGVVNISEPLLVHEEPKDFSTDLIASFEQTFADKEQASGPEVDTQRPSAPSRTSSSETIDEVLPKPVTKEVYLPALESQSHVLEVPVDRLQQSELTEVQEYWEEEEDEEFYDAEGYTTARSFRSRGENTTGGLTMLLEPRVTTRSLKELAAAKDFVEMTRTEEDVEDEAWDTSMVAEYGDDIFAYMRELEVSLARVYALIGH
jgi:G2/mitotic-specific cyclin 3/4